MATIVDQYQGDKLMYSSERIEPVDLGIRFMPDKCAIAMLPNRTSQSAILLPDEESGATRPDVGVVCGTGRGVALRVGDMVLVDGYSGKWVEDANYNGQVVSQVRFYGDMSEDGDVIQCELDEQIMATIDGSRLRPLGRNLLIAMCPLQDRVGELWIPDSEATRDSTATVLEVGDLVHEVKVGDKIVYHSGGTRRLAFAKEVADEYGVGANDLAMLSKQNVYGVIE